MKKSLLLASAIVLSSVIYSQNVIPNSGSVGVGTTSPSEALEVIGNIKVDSCVIVRDSIIVEKNARIGQNMKVAGQLYVADDINGNKNLNIEKNASINKNLTVEKKIIAPNLPTAEVLGNKDILIKGNNGVLKTTKLGALVDAVYKVECHQLNDGTYPNPIWNNKPGVIYAGAPCPPGTQVGIGTQNPEAKLDVRGTGYFLHQIGTGELADNHTQLQVTTKKKQAIVVTNQNDHADVFRVLADGTVWATEINVDYKEDFPDYVFDDSYVLMPLEKLEQYISNEKHLPNIPSAQDVKNNGINVTDLQTKQMEKIEELTLYMIQMNKRLNELEKENDLLKKEVKELKTTK